MIPGLMCILVVQLKKHEGAWLAFKSRFQTIVDSLALLKEIRIKQSTAPWITTEIIHTRSERDKALRKFALFTNYPERGSHCIVASLSANNNF